MDAGRETDVDELLTELWRLAERFPIPDGSWHRYATELQYVAADFAAAVTALERPPEAVQELGRRLDDDAHPVGRGGRELTAAAARLEALPFPAGEHPFLDEIAVTAEAMRQTIAALASVDGGEEAFTAGRFKR